MNKIRSWTKIETVAYIRHTPEVGADPAGVDGVASHPLSPILLCNVEYRRYPPLSIKPPPLHQYVIVNYG